MNVHSMDQTHTQIKYTKRKYTHNMRLMSDHVLQKYCILVLIDELDDDLAYCNPLMKE